MVLFYSPIVKINLEHIKKVAKMLHKHKHLILNRFKADGRLSSGALGKKNKQINNISPVGAIYLVEQLGFKYIMPTAFMFVYSISTIFFVSFVPLCEKKLFQ
ncbi:MAG TPA: hypothetical protein VJ440_02010 [Candidatus Brocadiaceae bacterium]|nr:hypothetical protein [Candidatus Brocadiaceae bacterium]